jgi:hypothetical protein
VHKVRIEPCRVSSTCGSQSSNSPIEMPFSNEILTVWVEKYLLAAICIAACGQVRREDTKGNLDQLGGAYCSSSTFLTDLDSTW